MSSYTSPYSRLGGGYGAMGAMGGMGSMYGGYGGMGGGYGGGMYGMSPYGMGAYGMGGEQSLVQSLGQSTQATFQIIESIVGAFGGFAQMLQSTYMATHSSFFGMLTGSIHTHRLISYSHGLCRRAIWQFEKYSRLNFWRICNLAMGTDSLCQADRETLASFFYRSYSGQLCTFQRRCA